MKNEADIKLTADEAALIPLLRSIPISNMTIGQAAEGMKLKLRVDALIQKVQKAFEEDQTGEGAQAPNELHKPKRKRR